MGVKNGSTPAMSCRQGRLELFSGLSRGLLGSLVGGLFAELWIATSSGNSVGGRGTNRLAHPNGLRGFDGGFGFGLVFCMLIAETTGREMRQTKT